MRNSKIVALVATAALLVIGAAFTSMAATYNWYQVDGIWHCKDKNGDDYTQAFAKSGSDMYYLDENGEMITETLVEDDDNYYYFDADGKMVKNNWVKVENNTDDGDDEFNWYYFQASGKAQKAKVNHKPVTINGKKYLFGEDGKMLYGWINAAGDMDDSDYPWMDSEYYCGDEEDGAVRTGWAKIDVEDPDVKLDTADQSYWFWFQTSGKKFSATEDKLAEKTINGKKYAFDDHGVMKAEWVQSASTATAASASISAYAWFQDAETGAKFKKGWFQVVPQETVDPDNNADDTIKWFYAKGDGTLYKDVVKTINGKKYAFDTNGEMLSGLYAMTLGEAGAIEAKYAVDDAAEMENLIAAGQDCIPCYFFGEEQADGSMKYGTTAIEVDGDDYTILTKSSGANKGRTYYGLKGSTWYVNGSKVKADADLRYQPFFAQYTKTSADKDNKIVWVGTAVKMFKESATQYNWDPEGLENKYFDELVDWGSVDTDYTDATHCGACLISSSGAIVKNATAKKDADDSKWTVKNYVITAKDDIAVYHDFELVTE